jgi:glycine dehydrogenase subunit 2
MTDILARAKTEPDVLHTAPHRAMIGRPDDVKAARNPVLRWQPVP